MYSGAAIAKLSCTGAGPKFQNRTVAPADLPVLRTITLLFIINVPSARPSLMRIWFTSSVLFEMLGTSEPAGRMLVAAGGTSASTWTSSTRGPRSQAARQIMIDCFHMALSSERAGDAGVDHRFILEIGEVVALVAELDANGLADADRDPRGVSNEDAVGAEGTRLQDVAAAP